MNSRFEIVVNLEYRTIKVISDDPQIQNVVRVGSCFFMDALPEFIYALKQVSETQPYSYSDPELSVSADCDLVRAWVYREDYEYYYEIDRKLFIEVLSAYAVKCYQHKEVLLPFCHIRDLSDVQHLLD